MRKEKNMSNQLFVAFLFAIIILVIMLVWPFRTAILISIMTAYLTYPLFKRLNKLIKNRSAAALVMSILIIIIISIPVGFLLDLVLKEARTSYVFARDRFTSLDFSMSACEDKPELICNMITSINNLLTNPQVSYYVSDTLRKIASYITGSISDFLFSIPMILVNFFIIMFVLFYIFRDAEKFFTKIENLIPMKKRHAKHIIKRVNEVTHAVIYGQLFVALIQGTLGAIGFLIFGIHSPFFWGFIMAILAIIPWVGTPLVWIPASLFQIIGGYTTSDTGLLIKGVLLFAYGTLIVSSIDNILKPKLIGDRGGIHPVLALLGVIGGISMFGIIGIFVGPVILAVFMTMIKIYEEEKGFKL